MVKLCKCRNTCQQIPQRDQVHVKVGENDAHSVEEVKLWVRL